MTDSLTRRRTRADRLRDVVLELTGLYRVWIWAQRGSIALSASVKSPSLLHLGRGVSIQKGSILHCGGKGWSGYRGGLRLGDGVRIGPYCVIYGAGGVNLDEHVHLGPGVQIMSQAGKHDALRLSSRPNFLLDEVRLGAGSWVGAGAVILGGTRVGTCVSIAPNSVVSGSIPDYAVVAGNPARVIFQNEPVRDQYRD